MADLRSQKFQQGFMIGQSVVDALEKKQMRDELKAANALTPEQQQLGVNAPAQGAVPPGYEPYIQVGEGGKFVPKQTEGLDEAGLQQRQTIAERFNAPGAFAGEKTMYTLGGLTRATPFTPEEVAQARMERKADIYSGYGKEDVAEQLRTGALQRQAASLQIKKLQSEVDDAAEFKKDLKASTNMLGSATTVAAQAKDLLDKGDRKGREGAARLILDWRSKNVPDDIIIDINPNGLIQTSSDGGKTWVQAAADKGNIYNPGVVENLLSNIKNSADEHLNRMMFKHAKSPEALSQMINATKELAMKGETFAESKRQFDKTFGLKQEELAMTKEQGERKLDQVDEELRLKGLVLPSEIYKNMGVGRHYGTANALQDFQLQQAKEFSAEKKAILKDLDDGKIDKRVAQERLNMVGFKYGEKLAEPKQITSTALKDIEEVAMNRYPDWNKMPEAKKQEVRDGLKAEMGFGSSNQPTVDYMSVVTGDKGGSTVKPEGGLQQRPSAATPKIDTSKWTLGMGIAAQNPDAVRAAVVTARNKGLPLDPQILEVAKYLDIQRPGIFDAGITGNANTSWLRNQ